jgi:hypothetical protein
MQSTWLNEQVHDYVPTTSLTISNLIPYSVSAVHSSNLAFRRNCHVCTRTDLISPHARIGPELTDSDGWPTAIIFLQFDYLYDRYTTTMRLISPRVLQCQREYIAHDRYTIHYLYGLQYNASYIYYAVRSRSLARVLLGRRSINGSRPSVRFSWICFDG